MMIGIIGLAVYALIIAYSIYFHMEVVRFLATYTAITDEGSLEAFKNLARRNMKAVFPFYAAFFVGMALTAQLIIYDRLIGFVTFLLVNGIMGWTSFNLNRVEKRARELPCPDPALASEYQRISKSWLSDFWPRF